MGCNLYNHAWLCRFFYHLFMCCRWRSSYQVGLPLTGLTLPHLLLIPLKCRAAATASSHWTASSHMFVPVTSYMSLFFFCVQWVKVRGDFSFCWYWKTSNSKTKKTTPDRPQTLKKNILLMTYLKLHNNKNKLLIYYT